MGADRVARVGAVRNGTPGAMPASGKRRNAAPNLILAAPIRPTGGRALLPASRVAPCLWCQHHGAARAELAGKIVPVKCVNISYLWYQADARTNMTNGQPIMRDPDGTSASRSRPRRHNHMPPEPFGPSSDVASVAAPAKPRTDCTTDKTESASLPIKGLTWEAPYHTSKYGVPAIRKAGVGVIMNVASTAGVHPRPKLQQTEQ